jgi:hypothetical protein
VSIETVTEQIVGWMNANEALEGLPVFKPIAYYDKHLDAIRVQIMDCSIWEERLDRIMTLYHANHGLNPDGLNDVVGFAIKGVRHLLKDVDLDWQLGPIELAKFLDEIFKIYPSKSTKFAVDFYRGLRFEKIDMVDVELPLAA